MKYLLYTILFFSLSNTSLTYAQDLPKRGSNLANPRLKKFAGNWIAVNGSDTLKIRFNFENIKLPVQMDLTADVLISYMFYKKANRVMIDDFKYANKPYNENSDEGKKRALLGGLNQLQGSFRSALHDGYTSHAFEYEFTPSSDLNTLTAVYRQSEQIYINEKRGKGYPDKMVFKREELN